MGRAPALVLVVQLQLGCRVGPAPAVKERPPISAAAAEAVAAAAGHLGAGLTHLRATRLSPSWTAGHTLPLVERACFMRSTMAMRPAGVVRCHCTRWNPTNSSVCSLCVTRKRQLQLQFLQRLLLQLGQMAVSSLSPLCCILWTLTSCSWAILTAWCACGTHDNADSV